MYIRDDKADEIVENHQELQQAIRGLHMMVVVPGHGSHLLVTMALTFGWMGSSIGVYGLSGNDRTVLVCGLASSLVFAALVGYFNWQVLRGRSAGRRRLYVFATSLLAFSIAVVAAALLRSDSHATFIAAAGVVASFVAQRGSASASYALFAAFFRAKRAYAEFVQAELDQVRRDGKRRAKRA